MTGRNALVEAVWLGFMSVETVEIETAASENLVGKSPEVSGCNLFNIPRKRNLHASGANWREHIIFTSYCQRWVIGLRELASGSPVLVADPKGGTGPQHGVMSPNHQIFFLKYVFS